FSRDWSSDVCSSDLALADVPDELQLDPNHLVTPIDVGDVCVNYAKSAYPDEASAPADLDDLTDERFANEFVTENPETSSPGFALDRKSVVEGKRRRH